MTPEHQRLINAYEAASKKIRDPKGGTGAESEYKIAYQNMVKAGIALQIKKKYR
jgi:hypothetical protein